MQIDYEIPADYKLPADKTKYPIIYTFLFVEMIIALYFASQLSWWLTF